MAFAELRSDTGENGLARLGQYDEPELRLREVLGIHPDKAGTRYPLGALLPKRGEFEEAPEHLGRATALEPSNPQSRYFVDADLSPARQRERGSGRVPKVP